MHGRKLPPRGAVLKGRLVIARGGRIGVPT
jgi:hypothetical protein